MRVKLAVTFEVEVDADTEGYPESISEIEDPKDRAIEMLKFDLEPEHVVPETVEELFVNNDPVLIEVVNE